jgi:hypothetical protein
MSTYDFIVRQRQDEEEDAAASPAPAVPQAGTTLRSRRSCPVSGAVRVGVASVMAVVFSLTR